jgi:hypothetical protein
VTSPVWPIGLSFAATALLIGTDRVTKTYLQPYGFGPTHDRRFGGFSPDAGRDWLGRVDEAGATAKVIGLHYLSFDLVLPALLAAALASWLYVLSGGVPVTAELSQPKRYWLAALAVLPYLAFDYGQNVVNVALLLAADWRTDAMLGLASALNVTKFLAFGLAFTAVLVLGAVAGVRALQRYG